MVTIQDIERVRPRLLADAIRAGLSADDAADLVQETVLRVWQNRHEVELRSDGVLNYAYRAFINRLVDHRRRAARSRVVLECDLLNDREVAELAVAIDLPGDGPAMTALRQLAPIYGDVLLLVDVGDLSLAGYADLRNITLRNARMRLRRGRRLVREILSGQAYLN